MVAAWTTVIEKDVAKDDHKAVCVRVHLAVPVKQTTLCRSPHTSLHLNNAEMRTPHAKKQCQAILRQMIHDHPGYDAPADLQAAYISEAAHQSLKDSFPPQPRVQRPSWITDETWKVVGASRQLRRRLQQLRSTAHTESQDLHYLLGFSGLRQNQANVFLQSLTHYSSLSWHQLVLLLMVLMKTQPKSRQLNMRKKRNRQHLCR